MTREDSKDEASVVHDDQSPVEVAEVEEQELLSKEVPNPFEKAVNSDPKPLFIDGYRAST